MTTAQPISTPLDLILFGSIPFVLSQSGAICFDSNQLTATRYISFRLMSIQSL